MVALQVVLLTCPIFIKHVKTIWVCKRPGGRYDRCVKIRFQEALSCYLEILTTPIVVCRQGDAFAKRCFGASGFTYACGVGNIFCDNWNTRGEHRWMVWRVVPLHA